MAKVPQFTIQALAKRHPVFRRRYDKSEFMRTIRHESEEGKQPREFDFVALLPRNSFELEAMEMQGVFDAAKVVVRDQYMRLPPSATSNANTVGDIRALADEQFAHIESGNRRLDEYAKTHFGRPYGVLVSELRRAVVGRFVAVFDKVLAIDVGASARTERDRLVLCGLDCWAEDSDAAEMIRIADEGHVYANWVAALLLTSGQPLGDEAVDRLLRAHDGKFPHALSTLAELLVVEGDFADALEIALLALDAGARWANSLVDRITEFTSGMVVIDGGPVRPLMFALVHEVIDADFRALAMKHRPQWRLSTARERDAAALAALNRGVHRE